MLSQRRWNGTARGRGITAFLRRDNRWRRVVCSAGQIVAHGVGLRVLLEQSVDGGYCSKFGEIVTTINDLDVGASGVILIFATHRAFGLHAGAPIPNKVGSQCATGLAIGWDEQISLTPLLELGRRLTRRVVAIGHLSVDREWSLVQLVTSAIVVVLCCHEPTFSIATLAILGPCEDVNKGLGCAGLVCAKDEDCATARGLTSRDKGLSDMAVLKVFQSDI